MGPSYQGPDQAWQGQVQEPTPYGDRWVPPDYDEDASRPPYLLVIICSALISALTVVSLFLVMETVTAGGKVPVPALVGMTLEQAQAAAANARLVINTAGQMKDPVIEKGRVARQDPLAGAQAKPGAAVAVTLSSGYGQITLGALAGLSLTDARDRLRSIGIGAGEVTYRHHPSAAAGQVLASSPGPGSVLTDGARVALVVSSGANPAASRGAPARPTAAPALPAAPPARARKGAVPRVPRVPRVTGIRLKFAINRLRSSGLAPGKISYSRDEDHMEDYVLSQSPRSGTPATRGETVDLVVNRVD